MRSAPTLAPFLQSFFTNHLIAQKEVSPHTITSYRDTFRLLLKFLSKRLRRSPSSILLEEVDAPVIVAFLGELEMQRGIGPRSRNLRLSAIRSFFRYLSSNHLLI